jgi:hypothetical protein
LIQNPYSHLTSYLARNHGQLPSRQTTGGLGMCHDMRRYEKIAEENRRRQNEQKIDFIIDEPEKIVAIPETKDKERQAKTY